MQLNSIFATACSERFIIVTSQVAEAPLGTVNVTLRNSVILRVCMEIIREKKIVKSTYLFLLCE